MWEATKEDTQLVLDALRAEIEQAGHSWRKMEIALNLGNGYFSHLFAGRIDLKFRHIVAICGVLGIVPREFFLRAYGVMPRVNPVNEATFKELLHIAVDLELTLRGYPRASEPPPAAPARPAPDAPQGPAENG
jgi:hypothetical protein